MDKNFQALIEKMEKEIAELKKGMAQNDEENIRLKIESAEQKGQITKLEDNNRAMQRKIERIETYFPKTKKVLINRRALPAELLSELFASLPMKNAFDILAKMPNCLLAKNVRKMLKSIEMAMRNNKWNEAQCRPELAISGEGLMVKHSGPNWEYDSVRAQIAIPKFNLNAHKTSIAYFEVEIVVKPNPNWGDICIGFCTQQFLLEGDWLGDKENSIGIRNKWKIWIDGSFSNFVNEGGNFQAKDVIGIGIVHFPANSMLKCFATCNGRLLGKFDLLPKFADLHLFPTVTMYHANNLIRANFGRDSWHFYPIPEHLAN